MQRCHIGPNPDGTPAQLRAIVLARSRPGTPVVTRTSLGPDHT